MKFSIVIPVFKTEQFLPRCLDSLVAQTDGDFEAIVVDDASPGDAGRSGIAPYRVGANPAGSSSPPYQAVVGADPRAARFPAQEILSKYDSRFRYLRHEKNRGAFQARCTGVKAAKGDYIVPVDPDDYLLPETLAKLREVIERGKPDVVSYWIDCDDGHKIWPHWCRHPAGTVTAIETLREIAGHKANYSIVSKVVRREIYQKAIVGLQLPPDAYVNTSEDFLATLAILLCSEQVSHLDYAGYRYFSNSHSITAGRRSVEGFRRACRETRFVHDAIRSMALRVSRDSATRACVEDIIALGERWFCTEVMEGPVEQMLDLSEILFEMFHAENVGRAFAEGYAETVQSKSYRVAKSLSAFVQRLTAVKSLCQHA